MAAGGIKVNFLAVTDKFNRSVDGMVTSLRGLGTEATKAGDQGAAAGSNLGSGLQSRLERQLRNRRLGKRLGTEFAQDFTQGLSSGNPAEALTSSILALGPALGTAGLAVAAGGAFILKFLDGMKREQARIKAAGKSAYEAFRDGVLDQAEKESLLVTSLGVESYKDAIDKAVEVARELNVPAAELLAYWESGGKVISGPVREALAVLEGKTANLAGNTGKFQAGAQQATSELSRAQGPAEAIADALQTGADAATVYAEKSALAAEASAKIKANMQLATAYLNQGNWSGAERVLVKLGNAPGVVRAELYDRRNP
jgi:hypothetical protein